MASSERSTLAAMMAEALGDLDGGITPEGLAELGDWGAMLPEADRGAWAEAASELAADRDC